MDPTAMYFIIILSLVKQSPSILILQEETKDTCQVMHKEEGKSRIQCDQKDRDGIKQKVSMCINPLDPSVHPDLL